MHEDLCRDKITPGLCYLYNEIPIWIRNISLSICSEFTVTWGMTIFIPPPNEGYTGITLSVCLSVCPSVCRQHGFRSVTLVWFGISISYACCLSPWAETYWFWAMSLSKWAPGRHLGFFSFQTLTLVWLWISSPNLNATSLVCMGTSQFSLALYSWHEVYWNSLFVIFFVKDQ